MKIDSFRNKRFASFAFAAGLAIAGCGGGTSSNHGSGPQAEDIASVPAGAIDPAVERFKVPLGNAAVEGAGDAKVTIVEFSDFQCPFCSRVVPTVKQIQKAYGKDVRVAFKNNPLPFHPNAGPAAQAALAAGKQGKFWEMYDKLFGNQQALSKESYDKWAKELGLDVAKFDKDFDSDAIKAQIKAEQAEAAKSGANGTPAFFLNGRFLSGAQPYDSFKKIVDEEIKAADAALAKGVKPTQLYSAFIKAGKEAATAPAGQRPQAPQMDQTVYKVPLGNAPAKGAADALVTIVEFSDFQCPFCSRVEPTIDQVMKTYGNDVRVLWKNNPLPFHEHAMDAALAANYAGTKGADKFWAMHDTLFKNQQALDKPALEKYLTEAGLDVAGFQKFAADEANKKAIQADVELATSLGARGTPSFFINGKNLRGAQPFDSFKSAIDAALTEAKAAVGKGTPRAGVYAEITKNGKEKADAPPAPKAPPADNTIYKALVEDAPVKGPKEAPVTIVEFSDFQCPFCSRVEPTITQLVKEYPNDVRVAFKQLPLPFHDHAHLAAEAALAAHEQDAKGKSDKFWAMHEKMFSNQQKLERADLESYAQGIGLNMSKFKEALDSGKFKKKVDEETAEGNKIGARGTPSFFVNGKKFVGAQPFDAFKAKVEEELKAARAVMDAKHLKGDKYYDELMKNAKAEDVPPPAAPTAAGGGPAEDKTVYKVDGGKGPSMGPANAPVQIVEFSDFQCPFCSRVVPTMKQIEEKYKGKIHLTWRNFPLPFHDKAMPAAEAAMAAADQGKFWEMHDKLFANQQSLDRASFEKFAGEIGLDMGKFKSALDSGAKKADVQADVEYANKLPGGGMGTPTFFINGRKIPGAMPFDAFAKIIDEEIAKAKSH